MTAHVRPSQIVVFPWFGLQASFADNLAFGGLFTAVSLIRGYWLRRQFARWTHL